MVRLILTDAQWAVTEPHCPGKKTDPGRTGLDGRMFVEAVLRIARTGNPWRDLPAGSAGIEIGGACTGIVGGNPGNADLYLHTPPSIRLIHAKRMLRSVLSPEIQRPE